VGPVAANERFAAAKPRRKAEFISAAQVKSTEGSHRSWLRRDDWAMPSDAVARLWLEEVETL